MHQLFVLILVTYFNWLRASILSCHLWNLSTRRKKTLEVITETFEKKEDMEDAEKGEVKEAEIAMMVDMCKTELKPGTRKERTLTAFSAK